MAQNQPINETNCKLSKMSTTEKDELSEDLDALLRIQQTSGCKGFVQLEKYITTMKRYAELGEKVVNEVDEIQKADSYISPTSVSMRLGSIVIYLVNELNSTNGTK